MDVAKQRKSAVSDALCGVAYLELAPFDAVWL